MKIHLLFAATMTAGLALAPAQEAPPSFTLSGFVQSEASASPTPAATAETPATEAKEKVEEAQTASTEPAPAPVEPLAENAEGAPAEAAPANETPTNPLEGAEPVTSQETFRPGIDEPLPLIPDTDARALSYDALPQGGAISTGPLKKGTAEQLRLAIKIREAKTAALSDPAVMAERAKADNAKTYEGRRTALRNYYATLHARMIKIDSSLKDVMEKDLHTVLSKLEQSRVRPSVLIESIKPVAGSRSADHAPKAQN